MIVCLFRGFWCNCRSDRECRQIYNNFNQNYCIMNVRVYMPSTGIYSMCWILLHILNTLGWIAIIPSRDGKGDETAPWRKAPLGHSLLEGPRDIPYSKHPGDIPSKKPEKQCEWGLRTKWTTNAYVYSPLNPASKPRHVLLHTIFFCLRIWQM